MKEPATRPKNRDRLRARAAMLNLLEADINLMTQDLNVLVEEVLVRDRHEP